MATKYIIKLFWVILILICIYFILIVVKAWADDTLKVQVTDTTTIEKYELVYMCFDDCYLNKYTDLKKWSKANDLLPKPTPNPTPFVMPTPAE